MTTRVTEGARRACTPLNKSEEKERLLAVYPLMQEFFFFFLPLWKRKAFYYGLIRVLD